jgi:hypothetical protein
MDLIIVRFIMWHDIWIKSKDLHLSGFRTIIFRQFFGPLGQLRAAHLQWSIQTQKGKDKVVPVLN